MVAKGDECTRRSAKTLSPSLELQALAVSEACVRICFICASVKILAVFKALSSVNFEPLGKKKRQ